MHLMEINTFIINDFNQCIDNNFDDPEQSNIITLPLTPGNGMTYNLFTTLQFNLLKAEFYPIIGLIPGALGLLVSAVEIAVGLALLAIGVFSSLFSNISITVGWSILREGALCFSFHILNPLLVNGLYVPIKVLYVPILDKVSSCLKL